AIVTTQIEDELPMMPAESAGTEFVLGKVKPGFTRRLTRVEQNRRHIVAVEDNGLPLTVLIRKLRARERRERGHEVEAAHNVIVLCVGLDLGAPGDGRDTVTTFAVGPFGAAEGRVAGVGVNVLPGAVIRGPKDICVLVEAERTDFIHDMADARI